MHITILGLGPSLEVYSDMCKRLGGKNGDEVWGINAVGDVYNCDLVFHMDDIRVQEMRAAAKPDSNIARMVKWMKTTKTPIMTSIHDPEYPTTQDFPLQEVMDFFKSYAQYFNSTAAYAVAYAIYRGATRIDIFGFDFTYANSHQAEKGRACVEYWIGRAVDRGIDVRVPPQSTLLDARETVRFYGYDMVDVKVSIPEAGKHIVTLTPKAEEELPTAEKIEAAYDHSAHPNSLMAETEEDDDEAESTQELPLRNEQGRLADSERGGGRGNPDGRELLGHSGTGERRVRSGDEDEGRPCAA